MRRNDAIQTSCGPREARGLPASRNNPWLRFIQKPAQCPMLTRYLLAFVHVVVNLLDLREP